MLKHPVLAIKPTTFWPQCCSSNFEVCFSALHCECINPFADWGLEFFARWTSSIDKLLKVLPDKKQLFSSGAGINTSGEHQDISFALKILKLFKVHPTASLMDRVWLLRGATEITIYRGETRSWWTVSPACLLHFWYLLLLFYIRGWKTCVTLK